MRPRSLDNIKTLSCGAASARRGRDYSQGQPGTSRQKQVLKIDAIARYMPRIENKRIPGNDQNLP
jgi:hypothetical protein